MKFQQFEAAQLRIARPTVNMKEVVSFYEEGLGLKRIGSFDQHEGYDGVMLGLPHQHVHLEITKHEEEESLPVPHPEQLLVFYISRCRRISANEREIALIWRTACHLNESILGPGRSNH